MKKNIKIFVVFIVALLSLGVVQAQVTTIQYKHSVVKYYNVSSDEYSGSPENVTTITYLNGDRSVYNISLNKIIVSKNIQSIVPHLALSYNPTILISTTGVEIPLNSILILTNMLTGEPYVISRYATSDRGLEFQCNKEIRGSYVLTARYGIAMNTVAILLVN